MGARAYAMAMEITYKPGECILEIGSERGEGSTEWLALLAQERGVPFYSIDFEQDAHERAREVPQCKAIQGYAEQVLSNWQGERIRFAYLDGFDWPFEQMPQAALAEQHVVYSQYGSGLSKVASYTSTLACAMLVDENAADELLVLVDDTWLDEQGTADGKGGWAVPWLLKQGYTVRSSKSPNPPSLGSYVALEG